MTNPAFELPENPLLQATEESDFLPTEESQTEYEELHKEQ